MVRERGRGGRPEGLSLCEGGEPLEEEDPAKEERIRRRVAKGELTGSFLLGIAMVGVLISTMSPEWLHPPIGGK